MKRAILISMLIVAAPGALSAQESEPLLPGSKGLEKESEPEPLPERKMGEEEPLETRKTPASTPEETPAPASAKKIERPARGAYDGSFFLGPSAISMPGTDTATGFAPAITLGQKSAFLLGSQFGLRWSSKLIIHDWEIIGDYYGWYNKGPADEVELKYLLLWPGLIFGPFVGANYNTGLGLVLYTSPSNPSFYFDAGIGIDLFLNPSDSFGADIGMSSEFTVGIDFNDNIGLGFTLYWGFPFFHGLFDGEGDNVPAGILFLSFL